MKKKNILNRPMFKQVKSPAYGTGISSNLVSDDQRQRYNYGGRVGMWQAGSIDKIPKWWDYEAMGPTYIRDGADYLKYIGDPGKMDVSDPSDPNWVASEKADIIPISYYDDRERWKSILKDPMIPSGDELDDIKTRTEIDIQSRKDPTSPVRQKIDRKFEEGTNWRENIKIPGVDVTIDDSEKEITEMPDSHLRRKTKFLPTENTEDIDIEKPDPFKTLLGELDKSAEEKKRFGKGKMFMDAAAAAMEWSGAATAKERAAAISKGLTKAGETGMKAATEGMDLVDKVKILKTMEDVKGGHKLDIWKEKLDKYYKPSIDLAAKEFDFKKATAAALKEDISPKDIYKTYAGKDVLNKPLKHGEILSMILEKNIPVASTAEQQAQYSKPENDGLIFIDINSNVMRNTNGEVKSVNVWKDKEFFGE